MNSGTLHLDIGPLREREYTGISQVTAAIAEQMLGDAGRETGFFTGRTSVARGVVEDLVYRRNGELLTWYLQQSPGPPAPERMDTRQIGLFVNRKSCRRSFHVECQVVHDLSSLLTPQFHTLDNVNFHALSLLEDVQSNDITFCVSEATRQDVLRYLGPLAPERVVTVKLGAAISPDDLGRFTGRQVEPFVLVLGTVEPRKNIEQVLSCLRAHRGWLSSHRFVFLGRHGWGESVDSAVRRHDLLDEYRHGRVTFTGFVGESTKNALLELADVVIYPSLFEGFGLPVLEALALGKPCVTTRSSSIPEVGGPHCFYFDPFLPGDFDRVFLEAMVEARLGEQPVANARRAWAAEFSWARCYRTITDAIDAHCAGT